MAKYILALIELEDDYALESYRVGQTYPGTAAANEKYAILDSANANNKNAFKMIDNIMEMPVFAQEKTAQRDKLDSFRCDVINTLTDEKPAPDIPEINLLRIYEDFQNEIDGNESYWGIYWDTLRDVLFKHGYEPEWED